MIKVYKDFTKIPSILTKDARRVAFNNNISSSSYIDKKNKYKVGSVQQRLNKIYNLKCAYCEKKLLDSPKHIEHYRPKSIYHWLAYSWDNLLLSCGNCNSFKGNRFKVSNSPVSYNQEKFPDIHNLCKNYNDVEKPMIVNPEQEDVILLIYYDKEGIISSEDDRVSYTINIACKLNRKELVELRIKLINDFINRMNEHFLYFIKFGDITRFCPDVDMFKGNCKQENEFYSLRYFMTYNIELFFKGNIPLQNIMKGLFKRYE